MKNFPVKSEHAERADPKNQIVLNGYFQRKKSFFAIFLISCAMLVAAFAAVYVWADGGKGWRGDDSFLAGTADQTEDETPSLQESENTPTEETETRTEEARGTEETEEERGEDRTPIRTAELSAGTDVLYIKNESIHTPDAGALLGRDVSSPYTEEPLVLIVHTHTSEGYLPETEDAIEGELGDVTYTRDAERNVLAVGRVLSDTLRKNGIGTVHCTTEHDAKGMRGAYASSAESVRFFLSLYPSIRYVIDLHRDAVLDSDGAYVRAVSETDAGTCAQIAPVVGTDGNGTEHGRWEDNLALALQLRLALNGEEGSVCRPVILRNASYNQELSPYSLLLEIGTGGNCIREAELAAKLVGDALAELILK